LVWGFILGSPWEVIMFQPPEKQYYEIDELSKLWDIDIKTIRQYIDDMKILRSAMITKNHTDFKCFKVSSEQRKNLENTLTYVDFDMYGNDNFKRIDSISIFEHCTDIDIPKRTSELNTPPPFLYSMRFHIASYHDLLDGEEIVAFTFENFQHESFVMVDKYSDIEFDCANLHPLIKGEQVEIIPTEEKEQFEKKYSQQGKKGTNTSMELTTKTKNSYLKTIHALSNALCDGLAGKVHKDAETVLAALDSKGVTHPVTSKTLAGYLTEAKKIDDNQ
jgi:hypothetical protein